MRHIVLPTLLFGLVFAGVAANESAAQVAPASAAPAAPVALTPAIVSEPVAVPAAVWTTTQAMQLVSWIDNAPRDGLPAMTGEAVAIRAAVAAGDRAHINELADAAAARLLDRHRNGTHGGQRRSFGITGDTFGPADAAIDAALTLDRVDALFAGAVPTHPHYVMLREALANEADAGRAATLRLNMDRWRWMPRNLGERYLLVNVPSFEVTLWENGQRVDRWRTVVGRTSTQTNIFSATVSGVVLNPWWEIPTSIANEGVAARVRANPAREAARGYIFQDGRYRQRPGPGNSLGRMKLVMPNGFAVFLHDTPAQSLFANASRAYSHGCVRVSRAVEFATTLLSARPGWTRANTDAILASGRTQTVDLPAPIPVYIGYFTAAPFTTSLDTPGELRHFADVYSMDR